MNVERPLRLAQAVLGLDRIVYAHYAVTHRCCLRCRSCAIWKRGDADAELSLDQIRELTRVLARLGCLQISLSGGEPTLRADLPEIVRAFQAAGIRTRVLTNGVDLTAELIDRLLAAGLRDVSFSLNSLRPDLQENLDDAGHTFERRIANLLALAERLPKNRTLPLLNTVVTPHNLDELERLVEFAERIGFYLSFIPVHLARDGDADHPAYGSDNDLRFTQESEAQVRATYQRLIEHKRRGAPILNSTAFLRRSADYLLGANAAWPCRAGRFYVSVAPDGRIGACHAFEGMRDVRYDEFAGKYADPSWRREFIRAPENCEGCLRPCWAEVSFMLTDARSLWEMARLQTRAWWPRRRVDVAAVRDWLRRSPGVA